MNVFYSNKFDTLRDYEPGVLFFEDMFSNKTWDEYPQCWRMLAGDGVDKIKCKTRDAILTIPADLEVKIQRVGQSIRNSNKGEIIVTPCPIEVFMMLEMGPYVPPYPA
jgi:hypothetical protein